MGRPCVSGFPAFNIAHLAVWCKNRMNHASAAEISRNQKNSMLTRRNQDLTTAKTGNSGFVPQILAVSYGRNPENRSLARRESGFSTVRIGEIGVWPVVRVAFLR